MARVTSGARVQGQAEVSTLLRTVIPEAEAVTAAMAGKVHKPRGGGNPAGPVSSPPASGGGGGEGGRIAILYNTNQFTGTVSARGGSGATYGGAGTIYYQTNKPGTYVAQIFVDNGGARGTNTPLYLVGGFAILSYDLTISGGAMVNLPADGGFGNLLITSNAWISQLPGQTLQPTVTRDATVQAGGGITTDGKGDSIHQGPGAGGLNNSPGYGYTGGGGGYGGYGGVSIANAAGGNSYGSLLQPTNAGSAGGGSPSFGFGGGAIKLTVAKTLALDGRISSDGSDAPAEGGGGGPGGSVWLAVGKLSGQGTVSANGGAGDFQQGGGGGGGRIALYYGTNAFTGPLSAHGGPGFVYGGAGTIYANGNGNAAGQAFPGQLLVDNAGWRGTNTPISAPEEFDLAVTGGAVVNPSDGPLFLGSLR